MKPLLITLVFLFSLATHAEIVESIVAIVNSTIVTKSDIWKYKERLRSGTIIDDLLGNSAEALLKDEKALLKHIIDERIVDDEVKKQNLSITFERVEQEVNQIQGRNGISREQLKAALKKEGTNFSDYQEFIKKRIERQSVIEKAITSKIKISDEDVASAYEVKNKSSSATSFEYKVSHILFREGKRSDSEQQKKAQEVYEKIKNAGNFEALASQYSEDPGFNEGGFLGTFRAGETLPPLEDSFKTLSPGEVAKPVKTKLGYHIVKLLERHVVSDAEFEKKKDVIRNELYQKAFVKQFQFWLDQKRQEAFIKIN
ncbi:MAG: peptidylprolyl isomerase [Oligoflexia bacterium]|nr:peptidylprolyl isomerase [Oligoflexia bacterium]